jgi:hypothetical protein
VNLAHGVYVCNSTRHLFYLEELTYVSMVKPSKEMRHTIFSLSTATFFCAYLRMLPLPNQGITTAGTGSVRDVSDHTGEMFGWHNEDHVSLAAVNVCKNSGE